MTIQAYASKLYSDELASNITVALYATFTLCCFLSPSFTRALGPIRALAIGIGGYAVLVIASLVYFILNGDDAAGEESSTGVLSYMLVLAGAINGVGSSLLWNSQGLLILQYSERGVNGGTIFGIFWAFFNVSAICGGAVSFFLFNGQAGDNERSNEHSVVLLFLLFLGFILSGALFTNFLLPPSELSSAQSGISQTSNAGIPNSDVSSQIMDKHESALSWAAIRVEVLNTMSAFRSKRLLFLSFLFFYTGYKQPYQLVTFGDRFFDDSTLGLEVMSFYCLDMIGGIFTGNLLDGKYSTATSSNLSSQHRKVAIECLLILVLLTSFGNYLALLQERPCISDDDEVDCVTSLNYTDVRVLRPSISYGLWGFTDSIVQTYCYWLMGLYFENAGEQSRAIGFYTCVQSLGWMLGFLTIPASRVAPVTQLYLTVASLVLGIIFCLPQIPRVESSSSDERSELLRSTEMA